jgi:4-hydroxy-tetrahydrodipicolinate synthase
MQNKFSNGVWPTMITPFTEKNEVDYNALENMIEWYIKNEVDGLFAVCQSSEMFLLSLEERIKLASFVKKQAYGRVPVIASGHVSEGFDEQVRELNLMAETGVDAVVLILNRLVKPDESDDMLKENLERVLNQLPPSIPLGFYECPYPYKRRFSPELLKWCADTERFYFLKDTSCDVESIREKLKVISGSKMKLYNANSATLYETLKLGVAGYSGVMANFHPEIYVWLMRNWSEKPEEAKRVSNFLSVASLIERQVYPINAKYHQSLCGLNINCYSRVKDYNDFTETNKLEIRQLFELTRNFCTI